jgi:hypothetical protein
MKPYYDSPRYFEDPVGVPWPEFDIDPPGCFRLTALYFYDVNGYDMEYGGKINYNLQNNTISYYNPTGFDELMYIDAEFGDFYIQSDPTTHKNEVAFYDGCKNSETTKLTW